MLAARPLAALGLAALLNAAAPAQAQFRVAPDWAEPPNPEHLSQHFPKLPQQLAINGRALISCRVEATGALTACSVIEEEPKGLGFAHATLALVPSFQMRPGLAPGARNPDDTVRIPVNFALPPGDGKPPPDPRSPESFVLAREIVETLGEGGLVARYYEQQARELEEAPPPGVSKETALLAGRATRSAGRANATVWAEGYAAILTQRLSIAQLRAMLSFVRTEAGRAYFAPSDKLRELMTAGEGELVRRFQTTAHDTFCADKRCDVDRATAPPPVPRPGEQAPLPLAPWAKRPTPAQLADAWPLGRRMGVTGGAILTCIVGVQGAPEECMVRYEAPLGLNVGAAALSLTDRFRVSAERLPAFVGKEVLLPLFFLADGRTPKAFTPPASSPEKLALARELVSQQGQILREEPGMLERDLKALGELRPDAMSAARAALEKAYAARRAAAPELLAGTYAAAYDLETLRAVVSFYRSDRTGLRAALDGSAGDVRAFQAWLRSKIADEAGAEFCRTHDCKVTPAQVRSESSAPSTRTP
ncbi:hypothetical protein [Phenylobacterium sp.]|jgi:hypothetical protein|uniref:hypothetical protein n=1 Tax=Phenylobacterium sp. TaxID=1871053 RepID=UPI002F92A93D